jgi:hypothetical protein
VSPRPKTNETRQTSERKPPFVLEVKLDEVCKELHPTSQCNTFKQMSNEEKYQILKNNKL